MNTVKARAFYGYPVGNDENANIFVGGEKHIFLINTVNTPSEHGFLDCSYFSGEGFTPGGIGAEPITLQTWHDYNTGISSNRTYNHNTGVFSPWT